jgi:hypothetical protein
VKIGGISACTQEMIGGGEEMISLIKLGKLIQVDIGGHPPIPIGSPLQVLLKHGLLYFFVIVGSTLLGLSKALHNFQMDIGGRPPNLTRLF